MSTIAQTKEMPARNPKPEARSLDERMQRGLAEHDAWVAEHSELLNRGKQKRSAEIRDQSSE